MKVKVFRCEEKYFDSYDDGERRLLLQGITDWEEATRQDIEYLKRINGVVVVEQWGTDDIETNVRALIEQQKAEEAKREQRRLAREKAAETKRIKAHKEEIAKAKKLLQEVGEL